jgi:hypothetical protein
MKELRGIQAEDLIYMKGSNELFNSTISPTSLNGIEPILVPLGPSQSSLQ